MDWDQRFLALAEHIATWSKDPSTRVGCVIVGPDREVRATGYNGFPRGIADDDRLCDRDKKYPLICHGEENAILNAARIGVSLNKCSVYIWPWPPCTRCSRSLVQVGIKRVVFPGNALVPERWLSDMDLSFGLLKEAGVEVADPVFVSSNEAKW